MPAADPARCPSCGAERPANAPGGLCPRCVLRRAMESGSQPEDEPAPGSSRLGPVPETIASSVGRVPQVRLPESGTTIGTGDSGSGPAVRTGSSEMPSEPRDVEHLELLGEIARGGMGAVLKGRDPDLGRDLAVKVLLEAHKDKPDLARRFIEEAQIAGQLQHPGVVPIYELGAFADRRPYFSMKLVKGRTLAALLEERSAAAFVGRGSHDPARRPTEGLRPIPDDRPRFVSIFEQVCLTMAYAHARGVIHRDLKPSNIMVGSFGEVQVMDWGLAKVLASGGVADESRAVRRQEAASVVRTLRTGSNADASQAGSVMGTPAYMPPEQAGGDVEALDERADVFGLGAILCEILTGSPAYVGRDGNEVFRKAIRGDLADARARLDACGADEELVALAKSCLAPELLDRPRDARVVSDRLTEHLAGVQERLRAAELARAAESARATEAVRKARAERRARRLAAGLAAAVFVAIALGGGAAAWFVSARDARRAAAIHEFDELLGRVVVLRARARASPSGAVNAWKEALAEATRTAERARDLDDLERTGRIADATAELEKGLRDAEVQAGRLEVDRKLLAELESVRGGRADQGPKLADTEYADAFRNAGLDLDQTDPEQAGGWLASRSAPVELALFLDDWATVRRDAKPVEGTWRRLVDAARAADKDPWRDALRAGIGTAGPDAVRALRNLAADEGALGAQPAESLRLLALRFKAVGDREAAARILGRAWRLRPDDFWVNFDLATSRGAEFGLAEKLYPRPEEAVRHLTAALAVRPRSAMAHTRLGIALTTQGKLDEAVAEFREAIRLQPDDAAAHYNLGNALLDHGKLAEVIAECREAIRLQPDDAAPHANLGEALRREGKLAEAVAEHREAIRIKPDLANAHVNLGFALRDQGKLDEAAAEFRKVIRLQPDLAEAHANLGFALRDQGKPAEAVAEYREAIRLQPDDAAAHANLGFALDASGRSAESIEAWRRSVSLNPKQPNVWYWLGRALLNAGRRDEAAEPFRQVLALYPAGSPRAFEATQVLSGDNPYERLWGIIQGPDRPKNDQEAMRFARMATEVAQYGAAARLWAEALAANPRLVEDRQARHRYDAACAAAVAGAGRGEGPQAEVQRARWRKQAVAWLEAELADWRKQVEGGRREAKVSAAGAMERWKADANLAGVRDPEALARLPADEQRDWKSLWAEVESLLRRAEGDRP